MQTLEAGFVINETTFVMDWYQSLYHQISVRALLYCYGTVLVLFWYCCGTVVVPLVWLWYLPQHCIGEGTACLCKVIGPISWSSRDPALYICIYICQHVSQCKMYICTCKGSPPESKNVFFWALPEFPLPPPLPPILANCTTFFGRQKRRFKAYYRTK